ncbi:MAG: flagellar hook-basal body complex protein, partial [Thermodesulfobacteriota bacterium]
MNSGVSGLQSFSNAMSVIGNNLGNTNTTGFKASRTLFSDLMPDTVSGSGGSSQVGRGSSLSMVDDIFKQGSIESTSSNLDLAIEGSGFFMVRNPDSQADSFTRAGTFRLDEQGNLTNPEGYVVQGYASNGDGTFEDLPDDIQINTRSFVPGQASSEVDLTTNLDAQETPLTWDISNPTHSSNFATTSEIYDSLGNTHLI